MSDERGRKRSNIRVTEKVETFALHMILNYQRANVVVSTEKNYTRTQIINHRRKRRHQEKKGVEKSRVKCKKNTTRWLVIS